MRQRCLECEEERARHEKEVLKLQRKESRQQEERNMMFQLAIIGLMAYFRTKKANNKDGKPPSC
jgi:hypothetical protein